MIDYNSLEGKLNRADEKIKVFLKDQYPKNGFVRQWYQWLNYGNDFRIVGFLLTEVADALKVELVRPLSLGFVSYSASDLEEDSRQLREVLNKKS